LAKGGNIAGIAIMLTVGLLVASAVLPNALQGWYNATATGGDLASAPAMLKTLWNLVPPMAVVAILAVVVYLGLEKMGRIG
jgi:hypothetical protein